MILLWTCFWSLGAAIYIWRTHKGTDGSNSNKSRSTGSFIFLICPCAFSSGKGFTETRLWSRLTSGSRVQSGLNWTNLFRGFFPSCVQTKLSLQQVFSCVPYRNATLRQRDLVKNPCNQYPRVRHLSLEPDPGICPFMCATSSFSFMK